MTNEELPTAACTKTFHHFRLIILVGTTMALTCAMSNPLLLNFTIICMCKENRTEDAGDNSTDKLLLMWSKAQRSTALSSFAWGAIASIVPLSICIQKYGAKLILSLSVVLSSAATLACPVAAFHHFYLFLTMRVLQGVGYAAALPALAHMTSHWAKTSEKARFLALGSSCIQFSPIITLPIGGWFCGSQYGWPMAFYVIGISSLAIVTLWCCLYQNDPTTHRCVSRLEIAEIHHGKTSHKSGCEKSRKVPFSKIVTSRSVMAIIIATFGNMCGIQLIITYMPTYLKLLSFDIRSVGFLSTIPSVGLTLVKLMAGVMSDKIRLCETVKVRLFNTVAFVGMAGCYVGLSFLRSENDKLIALALFSCGASILGFNSGSFFKSVSLVGQHYAGFIMGMVQLTTCAVILVLPYVVGSLTPVGTIGEWRVVFWLTAGLLLVTNAIFCAFGQGVASSWAGGVKKPPHSCALLSWLKKLSGTQRSESAEELGTKC